MSEPYTDEELEEFWGNVQYDNLGSSYCEISGIPQKDWRRLIATVEQCKQRSHDQGRRDRERQEAIKSYDSKERK